MDTAAKREEVIAAMNVNLVELRAGKETSLEKEEKLGRELEKGNAEVVQLRI